AADSIHTYYVQNLNAGCPPSAAVPLNVNVLQTPTVFITPPNPAICSGQYINLTGNGAVDYTWSPASYFSSTSGTIAPVSPPSPDSVWVVGTAANGCTDSAS